MRWASNGGGVRAEHGNAGEDRRSGEGHGSIGRLGDRTSIQILFTGRRPGEKLNEELFAPEERLGVTSYEHILMANGGDVLAGVSDAELDELVGAAERRNWHELERCFRGLFPDVARAVGPIDRDVRDATMPSSLRGQM